MGLTAVPIEVLLSLRSGTSESTATLGLQQWSEISRTIQLRRVQPPVLRHDKPSLLEQRIAAQEAGAQPDMRQIAAFVRTAFRTLLDVCGDE